MNLGYLTIILVVIAFIVSAIGAFGIAKYAFRISTGKGVGVLLFPPYTFYFSFFELQEEGKEKPIALWMWGLITTILIVVAFLQPIQLVLSGRADELNPPTDAELTKAYGAQGTELEAMPDAPAEPPPAPASTNNGTNNGTNSGTSNSTNAGTNAGTNNAAAPTEAAPADGAPAEAPAQ